MAIATGSRNRKPLAAPSEMKNTRKAVTKARSLPKPSSDSDRLAAQLAKTLLINDDTKGKGKQKVISVDEQKLQAMRMINSASQKLSGIVQSGWKKSTDDGKRTRSQSAEALEASTSAAKHLILLRDLPSDDLNVERAAMSILGKLVALEMVRSFMPAENANLFPFTVRAGFDCSKMHTSPALWTGWWGSWPLALNTKSQY